ncbi:MAG: helix-turn-helix domain-containing protein [Pseudomonadota bacterium]|nr:helix-turn-helix domain-containing protein [Pseudomonadota bacterium]MEE3101474.1 helix-turn-helix domain-containing protein [Pseudomonadota bacterium]
MKLLDIGEVAAAAGLPPSTLRYYDEIGLVPSDGRRGLRRLYAPDALLQLKLVAMGRAAGFSLDEIAGMFGPDGRPDPDREALHAKADELDRRIHALTALRDTIRHVADCPAPRHMDCPTFRRLVELAGRRPRPRRKPRRRAAPGRD